MSENIVLLMGNDLYKIKQATLERLTEQHIDAEDTQVFDMDEINVAEAVNAAMTIPFLCDRKAVVLLNVGFFSGKVVKDIDHDVAYLLDYFAHPSEATLLILQIPYEKIDLKKDILALIQMRGVIIKFEASKKQDLYEVVRAAFAKSRQTIDGDALEELIRRVDEQPQMLEREIEKLQMYSLGRSVVTLDMIEDATPKNLEDNLFELINQIIAKNSRQAVRILSDLTKINIDPVFILSALTAKLQEILYAKALIRQKTTFEDMMKYFGYSKGRMYYVQKNATEVVDELLHRYLNELEALDYKIKSGQIDKLLGLELFLFTI
ncbi:MAG: DNA polymerase III subunit delta [Bacillus subtilis]|nr:DNA polymerase III subunit delta [Bacillus subtilis]